MKKNRNKVWILDNEGLPHSQEIEIYKKYGIVYKITTKKTFEEDFENYGKNADAIVAQVGFHCSANFIEQLERCKIICAFGMGFNHIDLEAAKARNIFVCNVPNYCATEVADHTLALSLTLIRKLLIYNNDVKKGNWNPTIAKPIHRMDQIAIGLLGFGQIAQMVAKRFKPFGVKLIAHDPFVSDDTFQKFDVESVTLDELLTQSYLLSLHIPLTEQTRGLINGTNMKKLPKGAIIVNTCRGGIIDEQALAQLIIEGHISGAGIDVFEEEPIQENHLLKELDNVILTPHAAYYSIEAEKEMQIETAMNIVRVIQNKKPINIVNGL